jgi:AAA ATPase-like protein
MELNVEQLFTLAGAVTVDKRYQFAGREDILKRAYDDLTLRGFGLVLFGERGVGKTSLGWQLFAGLSGDHSLFDERNISIDPNAKAKFKCIWLTCTDFIETISDLTLALLTDVDRFSIGSAYPGFFDDSKEIDKVSESYKWRIDGKPNATVNKKTDGNALQPSNNELAAFLAFKALLERARQKDAAGTELVIFMDEFDQVQENTRVGVLIKALNNVRFVVIGVSENRANLIGQHPSIGRKMSSYEVPLLRQDNIEWFFDSIERAANGTVRFEKAFRVLIGDRSSGFPWLVQQLGYYSTLNAASNKKSGEKTVVVGAGHYKAIINDFLSSQLGGDDFNINSLSEVAKKILIALAAALKGRRSEEEIISALHPALRPFFDKGLQELKKGGLVYGVSKEIRIKDPLTKVLVSIAVAEGRVK